MSRERHAGLVLGRPRMKHGSRGHSLLAASAVGAVTLALLSGSLLVPVAALAAEPLPRGPMMRAVVVTDGAGEAAKVARSLPELEGADVEVVDARPTGRTLTIEVPVASAPSLVAAIEATDDVAAVVPETTYSLFDVPDDPQYVNQGTSLRALNLPAAWDVTHGAASVLVAVIDTGVAVGHPDLAATVVGRYDATTGGTTVTDKVGHGTMVASMAAASTNNGEGMAGSGWNSRILAVKVADEDEQITNAALADGIDWAVQNGADVINLSLGSETNDLAVQFAVADAVAQDVVVVAAAGNSGGSSKFYPAALPDVLAVGATTIGGGSRATFSQYGSWVDVGAPGVSIVGANTLYSTATDYVSGDGTSFASPLVAGVAALVRASRPELTQAQVRLAISETTKAKAYGFRTGLVDAYAALGYELEIPGPAVLSPLPDAIVSEVLTVSVDAAAEDADYVQASLVGGVPSVRVPLVAGAATLELPSDGFAGTETLRVVLCRQSLCSTSGTDVSVNVVNPAPTVTSPPTGTRVTSDFVVEGASGSPAVRFVADLTTVLGTDLSSPFSLAVAVSRLAPGTHSITVLSCDSRGTVCATDRPSTPIELTVARLSPTITALTPNPFSPDGDGRKDDTTVTYRLDVASTVKIQVKRSDGTTFTTKNLGTQAAGAHSWTWYGHDPAGVLVTSGAYSMVVNTSAVVAGESLVGQAVRGLAIDKVNPTLTSKATTYPTVYPYRDGYRDSTKVSVTVSEKTSALVARVYNSQGKAVWSSTRSAASSGRLSFVFGGRSTSGALLAPGTYSYAFIATDPAGNVTTSPKSTVKVSAKRLSAARTTSRTLTARTSFDSWGTPSGDDCSGLYSSSWANGAIYWDACPGGAVVSFHHLTIPSAVKYGTVRVGSYARGSSGAVASILFIDDSDVVVAESHFDSDSETHTSRAIPLDTRLLEGQQVRWGVSLEDGDSYEAKTFTITWTYYILV